MSTKYLRFRNEVIPIHQNAQGFWQDDQGGLYAMAEKSASKDDTVACGVAPFDLPNWTGWMRALNESCAPHDFMYSSPVYQAFHTRAEADAALEASIETAAGGSWWSIFAAPFSWIARQLGADDWENKETR